VEDLIESVTRGNPTVALGHLLPPLGVAVWLLLALTWLTSAGDFLADS
jgi:hypothetical protein